MWVFTTYHPTKQRDCDGFSQAYWSVHYISYALNVQAVVKLIVVSYTLVSWHQETV